MKHLRIEYTTANGNSVVLFDGDVSEVVWSDNPNGVRVEGKIGNTGGGGLLELLTNASKARTEAVVEEKRAALQAEDEDEAPAPKPKKAAKPVQAS